MEIVIPRTGQWEIALLGFFILSFLHPALILLFFLYLLVKSFRSIEAAVKGLVLIAIRTIINPSIAVNIGTVQMIKWLTIFALGFLIIFQAGNRKRKAIVNNFIILEIVFCIYVCCVSVFNSSYPLVSMFKCFSYGFIFIAVIIGISSTCATTDWAYVLYHYLSILMLGSIICSPFAISYYSSAHWFMGLTNQSQMFGIMAALYSALLLYHMMRGYRSVFQYGMLSGVAVLTFLSGSRTGMIATVLCIAYGFYVEVFKNKRIVILIITIIVVSIVALMFSDEVYVLFREFILKDSTGTNNSAISLESITLSRRGQLDNFLIKYNNDPLFGSGFMVPYVAGVQDWSFSFNLLVENGNLFYSVLGDLGIIGFFIFCLTYGYLFFKGSKRNGKMILYIAPFLVSMGEMIFFSTNNNAILLYAMLAIFLT